MKISKYGMKAIIFHSSTTIDQYIHFDTENERDVVFDYWTSAIDKLKISKAIYRPVYEAKDGDTRILKLRYTTPEELISVENSRKEVFGIETMKLVMIYNEQERTFQNVNN